MKELADEGRPTENPVCTAPVEWKGTKRIIDGDSDPSRFYELGLWLNVPEVVYRAWPGINYSSIKGLAAQGQVAAHYIADRGKTEERSTVSKEFGRVGHAALLEPDTLDERFRILPDINPETGKKFARRGKYWESLQAQFPDAAWVSAYDMARAKTMAAKVRENPKVSEILDGAQMEVSAQWLDPGSGLVCKTRIDIFKPSLAADAKTTIRRRPYQFCRDMYRYAYHVQSAMITDCCSLLLADFDPHERPMPFDFIAIESQYPHLSYIVGGHDGFMEKDGTSSPLGFLELGRNAYRAALQHIAWCIVNDTWPGHSDERLEAVIPAYAAQEI